MEDTLDLSEIDLISIFVSAIIHDYGHPGLNNNYLIRTKDNLAIKYNDISVLENYHVSEAFNIICFISFCVSTSSNFKPLVFSLFK